MNEETVKKNATVGIYKPNGKGTGGAITLEIEPASGKHEGYLILTLANQCGNPDKQEFPHFDWGCAIRIRLGFREVVELLQLLSGETEYLREGRGIYIIEEHARITLRMQHIIDPTTGYIIEADYTACDANNHASLVIDGVNAAGISYAIKASMGRLAFGD